MKVNCTGEMRGRGEDMEEEKKKNYTFVVINTFYLVIIDH